MTLPQAFRRTFLIAVFGDDFALGRGPIAQGHSLDGR